MVQIPGGSFLMGSDRHYREERPTRRISVEGFRIDRHPVTNAEFRAFVEATGYLSTSERQPDPRLYPDADPELLAPGSLVFVKPDRPVGLRDFRQWWAYVLGASWRRPLGPDSSLEGLDDHPVVHVSYEDAAAYAAWAGKSLPTEAEWEFAARGGLDGAVYPWGDEFMPDGRMMANTWQGQFPWQNSLEDGYERTSPVGAYPPNGYGLHDVVGNVWEWTTTAFGAPPGVAQAKSCCVPGRADDPSVRHVVKGGSHLCAPNYCLRYRPAARQGQTLDTATSHIGFRCVIRG
ncbi:formylglycine-generating enzyme family protein [Verticiella sediminum]|uniref:Formylglycine-generating enzyme family protein n=1 Tax=Verticiella sediminum TaxID=1247510 RepID=A0A556ACN9_9BURK|nr:formylglycine-generating enzyme family protein [Verticiella sediminum]TSH90666.1 formylglycine-generating enzyme family protein [Verticiella sediminum]